MDDQLLEDQGSRQHEVEEAKALGVALEVPLEVAGAVLHLEAAEEVDIPPPLQEQWEGDSITVCLVRRRRDEITNLPSEGCRRLGFPSALHGTALLYLLSIWRRLSLQARLHFFTSLQGRSFTLITVHVEASSHPCRAQGEQCAQSTCRLPKEAEAPCNNKSWRHHSPCHQGIAEGRVQPCITQTCKAQTQPLRHSMPNMCQHTSVQDQQQQTLLQAAEGMASPPGT